MTDANSNTAITPFWRFSLTFYRQTGVSDACIALQDGCGIDVNLLLFLFWLASEGRQLSADDVKKLDDQVRSWRELTIIPIRDIAPQAQRRGDAGRAGQAGGIPQQGEGRRAGS